MKEKILTIHKKTKPVRDFAWRYLKPRHLAAYSASAAFWLFLSLVPTVILLSSILPFTSLTEETLLNAAAEYVPESMEALLREIILDVYSTSGLRLSVSALTTLWSASMGISALIRGLQEIYERPDCENYFIRRGRGILFTIIILLLMVASLLLSGLSAVLRNSIEQKVPFVSFLFTWLGKLRFLVMPALLTLAFASLYCWAPRLKLRFRNQIPGALVAALGWSVFSWAFSLWLSLTNGYGTYGSLATVAVVMAWLYYCMMILLMGGALNRGLQERKKQRGKV